MCGIFAYLNFLTPRSRSHPDVCNDNYTGNDNDFMKTISTIMMMTMISLMIVLLKGSHQGAGDIMNHY